MLKAFLLTCPVEEIGGEGRVDLDFEHLGDEAGGDAAELVELGDDGWAPAELVLAEGVGNESSDGREAEGGREEVLGRRRRRGRGGSMEEGVWVPVLKMKRLGLGLGLRLGPGEGLAIGEEATADDGAVL